MRLTVLSPEAQPWRNRALHPFGVFRSLASSFLRADPGMAMDLLFRPGRDIFLIGTIQNRGKTIMGYKIVDLSQELYTGVPVWIGHQPTEVTVVATHEQTRTSGRFTENYSYTSEKISMCTHGTTHVDSISHIDPTPGAPSIEKISLDWFYTKGICIDLSHIPPRATYSVDDIKQALAKHRLEIRKGDTLLVYTGH